jgi:uncharacterized protein
VSTDKLQQLHELIRSYGSCLVAYSGGVDSVFLARVAHDVLGERSLAVIADSPSLPRRELADALEIAERFQIPVRVVRTREFNNANYVANPANRCYFCKHELFTELEPVARSGGYEVIVYGENASDQGDFRAGAKAAAEFRVRAPLKEVGLTKAEIRALSAQLGLPTADKPQMACLSSRIPHGEDVTPEKLYMVEQAELFLRDLGFHDVRVRTHELVSSLEFRDSGSSAASDGRTVAAPETRNRKPESKAYLARIEVGVTELPKLMEGGNHQRVVEALRKIGYTQVTLDLQGYRSRSLMETSTSIGSGV